jgi:hypothetical protein
MEFSIADRYGVLNPHRGEWLMHACILVDTRLIYSFTYESICSALVCVLCPDTYMHHSCVLIHIIGAEGDMDSWSAKMISAIEVHTYKYNACVVLLPLF